MLCAIRNSSDDANGDRGYADPMDPVKRKRRQQQQQNNGGAQRRNKSADAEERDRQMGTPANRQRVRVVDAEKIVGGFVSAVQRNRESEPMPGQK